MKSCELLLLLLRNVIIDDWNLGWSKLLRFVKNWSVLVSVCKNGSNGDFWFERCFGSNFIWFWTPFSIWKRLGKLWNQIWVLGIQNWDFGMKSEFFVTANCQYSPRRVSLLARRAMWSQRAMFARHGEQSYSLRRALWQQGACFACHGEQRGDREGTLPATASYSAWEASCLSSSFSVLHFGSFSHVSTLN